MTEPRILVVDDEQNMRFLMKESLTREGYYCHTAENGTAALSEIRKDHYDLIILDYKMPGMDGLETLRAVMKERPNTIAIMVTAHDTREIAMKAVEIGAYDYFSKPFDLDEMRVVIKRALEKRKLQFQVEQLRQVLADNEPFAEMIGRSKGMNEVFDVIRRVADQDVNVMITGESGTGKELVARALHRHGSRVTGPFVAINCAAIPSTLLESELFGHERGAFTGAVARKLGRLELSKGGTLFLDEIGDMDFALQAKLLRVIQERVFERVGGSAQIETDFRLISATNKDLAKFVREGKFREDLFFRLNVVSVRIPPLRERVEDIPILVEYFLEKYAREYGKEVPSLSDDALSCLAHYSYPGNVRELENLIQRMIVLTRGNYIGRADLSKEVGFPGALEDQTPQTSSIRVQPVSSTSVEGTVGSDDLHRVSRQATEGVEREMILKALNECRWKRGEAAKKLGISRRSLLRKMNKYSIE